MSEESIADAMRRAKASKAWPYPSCGRRQCGRDLAVDPASGDKSCPEHKGEFLPDEREWR